MEEEKIEKKSIKKYKIVIPIVLIILTLLTIFITYMIVEDTSYNLEEVTEISYYKLYENEKYGVIDTKGNILVDPKYDLLTIPNPSKAVFIGQFDYNSQTGEYKTEVVNDKNQKILTQYKVVLALMFKDVMSDMPYEKSVLTYKENDKYGIISYDGKKITKPIYDSIESLLYKEGCLLVKQDEKYGIINIKGKELVDIEYDTISADGYYEKETKYEKAGFIVGIKKSEGYRYGYINNKGKKILDVEYNEMERITDISDDIYLLAFKNGLASVYKNNKQITKHIYEEIEYNKLNDLFIVQKNSKQGVIDIKGKNIVDVNYDYIMITEDSILTKTADLVEIFDKEGNKKEEENYITKLATKNNKYFITTNKDELSGIIDKDGNTILENEYSYIEYVYSDFFITIKNEKVGVINANTKEYVLSNYSIIQKINGFNALQVILTEPYTIEIYNERIEKVASMKEANLIVEENYIELYSSMQRKYFDINGNEINNTEILKDVELFAIQDEKGKWGFINKDGNVVIEPVYDMVTELNTYGFAGIKKDNKWGVINSKGELILEPKYEIEWEEPEFIGEYIKLNFGYGMIYYTKTLDI